MGSSKLDNTNLMSRNGIHILDCLFSSATLSDKCFHLAWCNISERKTLWGQSTQACPAHIGICLLLFTNPPSCPCVPTSKPGAMLMGAGVSGKLSQCRSKKAFNIDFPQPGTGFASRAGGSVWVVHDKQMLTYCIYNTMLNVFLCSINFLNMRLKIG